MTTIGKFLPVCPKCGHTEFDRIVDLDARPDETYECTRCKEKTPAHVFSMLSEKLSMEAVDKLMSDDAGQ